MSAVVGWYWRGRRRLSRARKTSLASNASRVTRTRALSMPLASFSRASWRVSSFPWTNSTSLGTRAPCDEIAGRTSATSLHMRIWLRMKVSMASISFLRSSVQFSNLVVGTRFETSILTPRTVEPAGVCSPCVVVTRFPNSESDGVGCVCCCCCCCCWG